MVMLTLMLLRIRVKCRSTRRDGGGQAKGVFTYARSKWHFLVVGPIFSPETPEQGSLGLCQAPKLKGLRLHKL